MTGHYVVVECKVWVVGIEQVRTERRAVGQVAAEGMRHETLLMGSLMMPDTTVRNQVPAASTTVVVRANTEVQAVVAAGMTVEPVADKLAADMLAAGTVSELEVRARATAGTVASRTLLFGTAGTTAADALVQGNEGFAAASTEAMVVLCTRHWDVGAAARMVLAPYTAASVSRTLMERVVGTVLQVRGEVPSE